MSTTFDFALPPPAHDDLARLRARIGAAYRAAEAPVVQGLIDEARLGPAQLTQVQGMAAKLVEGVRASRIKAGGVDALMHEFSLDSDEGVALMCLAEALLRIPDTATRDRLIREKIGRGDWRTHVGASPSLFVNAAAWGLLVSGKLVDTHREGALEGAVASLLRKGGEPLIRKGTDLAMRLLGEQFVTGRTIEEALERARPREARGYRYSYDMLGEAALTGADALRYHDAYEAAIHSIGKVAAGRGVRDGPGISLKLSALHPRYVRAQRGRVLAQLLPRVVDLAQLARRYDIGFNIDTEEADRLDLSLDVLAALAVERSLAGWDGLGFVIQTYQKRARPLVDWIVALARSANRKLMVRLVKGAYWDSEIKRAQVDGLDDYPVFTRKVHTDVAYIACAKALLAAGDAVYPQFATHNAFTIAAVTSLADDRPFEFQCLHGMGETVYDQLVGAGGNGPACRIYAPVGAHETLLAYLVRRLLENGANTSFVNRIVDLGVPIFDLVADPVALAVRTAGTPHPQVPLPSAILPGRRNSAGVDLSGDAALAALAAAMELRGQVEFRATPLLGGSADEGTDAERYAAAAAREIRHPADARHLVGTVVDATPADATRAVGIAIDAGSAWSSTPATERAAILERAADLMEAEMPGFLALAVREAGKTLPNAVGEVREAVDFCRYYAAEARRVFADPGVTPIGPVVAIAPWNFPLAIFAGEVAAALAAGNPVLAKPAEQTPLMAFEAVRLFHRAGVPRAALQFLPGPGETVGAALASDPRIAGVVFTGSTAVARQLNRALAERTDDPVLIAETGGQNAMIVDSSALLEQVTIDALASAFDSAGQRCSALRLLCVQADVAEPLLAMLSGALAELSIGDPRRLATDIGPVIDAEARTAIADHVQRMRELGYRVVQPPVPHGCENGTFVAPAIVDLVNIDGIGQLKHEVFGPVLHVVRWTPETLPALIDAINETGFALTHGIHTRIDEQVETILARIRAGNVYVNRNIIGAVVGVQPFGGHGLSGTGPKAGGPLYVPRLARHARIDWPAAPDEPPAPTRAQPQPNAGAGRAALEDVMGALTALNDTIAETASLSSEERHELTTALAEARAFARRAPRIALPGPTGESNALELRPRGIAACLAATDAVLMRQAVAAIAAGNRLLLRDSALAGRIAAALGPDRCTTGLDLNVGVWRGPVIDVALVDLPAPEVVRVRAALAAADGAIVPVVAPDATGRYAFARLCAERTVTINTTAAGGNAALMAQAGDDE
jgi:RHH-type proline utilization regulon transcriptional repressor/proline dehydrogenase/delta 1-pyrroline-5-carboxylate dehydrogenase